MKGQRIDGIRAAKARLALPGEEGEPLTQAAAAVLLDVHPVTLNRIENDKARVSTDLLDRMCDLYGRSREWFLCQPERQGNDLIARRRIAEALTKIGEGFEDFSVALDELYARAAEPNRDQDEVRSA